jgi:IS30 family transposase
MPPSLERHYKDKIYTITADNEKEFARYEGIEKRPDVELIHCASVPLMGAGSNENTDGLKREYILKGTDICELTDDMLSRKP